MNKKKILCRNLLLCFLVFLLYFATCLTFFFLVQNQEKSETLSYANRITEKLTIDGNPETACNHYPNDQFHVSFFYNSSAIPVYDNLNYTDWSGTNENETAKKGTVSIGYDEALKEEATVIYAYHSESGYLLRLARVTTGLYRKSKLILLYGSLSVFVGVIIAYILLYLSFKRALRPLKLQISKLQDITQKDRIIEYEDDLNYLTAIIRDSRHQLKHQLSENIIGEQKIAFVLDSFSQGLIVIDSNYHVILVNTKALSIYNLDKEDVQGHSMEVINTSHELTVNFSMVIHTKKSITCLEKRDGRVYQCSINPIQFSWTQGKPSDDTGASLLMIDVTDEYNSGEMKKEFFANASHELKSPLTSILGYLQLIENGTLKGEMADKAIGKCIDDAHRMNTIISDMLALSSLEREALRPIEEINLPQFTDNIISSLKIQAESKNISIHTSYQPFVIKMNTDDLDKLLRNFIDNAIKYNKENGKIFISIHPENRIMVIRDTGIGIAKENQARVYERFFRVDKARSRKNGGTGLGLAIVKHICNYYDLQIELQSELDKGTEFTIHFPE